MVDNLLNELLLYDLIRLRRVLLHLRHINQKVAFLVIVLYIILLTLQPVLVKSVHFAGLFKLQSLHRQLVATRPEQLLRCRLFHQLFRLAAQRLTREIRNAFRLPYIVFPEKRIHFYVSIVFLVISSHEHHWVGNRVLCVFLSLVHQ